MICFAMPLRIEYSHLARSLTTKQRGKNNYTSFDLFANIVRVLKAIKENHFHQRTPHINDNSICFTTSHKTIIKSVPKGNSSKPNLHI